MITDIPTISPWNDWVLAQVVRHPRHPRHLRFGRGRRRAASPKPRNWSNAFATCWCSGCQGEGKSLGPAWGVTAQKCPMLMGKTMIDCWNLVYLTYVGFSTRSGWLEPSKFGAPSHSVGTHIARLWKVPSKDLGHSDTPAPWQRARGEWWPKFQVSWCWCGVGIIVSLVYIGLMTLMEMIAIHGLGWKKNNADCDPTGKICLLSRFWPALALTGLFKRGSHVRNRFQIMWAWAMGQNYCLKQQMYGSTQKMIILWDHLCTICDHHMTSTQTHQIWKPPEAAKKAKTEGKWSVGELRMPHAGGLWWLARMEKTIWWHLMTVDNLWCMLLVVCLSFRGDTIHTSIFWTEMSLST